MLGPAGIIMLGTLLASLLGFVRAYLVARLFGAGPDTDAFFAAMLVPQTLYDQLVGGAIAAVFIPVFARRTETDDLRRLAGGVTVTAGAILVAMTVLLELLAAPLMRLLASGYAIHLDAGTLPLSVRLLRLALPSLALLGMSAVLTGALYASHRRLAASFSRVCLHLGVILAAVAGAVGWGVEGLAIGVAAGAALQFAVLVGAVCRTEWRPGLPSIRPGILRDVARLYAPMAGASIGALLLVGIDLNLKSHLPETGALSSMQYATQIVQFPIGIVVAGLGLAILPSLARDAERNRDGFRRTLAIGVRLVMLFAVPASVGLFLLADPIVSVLFQHGAFGSRAAAHTVLALEGYAPQLPLVGLYQLLAFAFYARHNTLAPAVVSVLGVAVYLGVALLLLGRLTILGLAIANTVQIGVQAAVLLALLLRVLGPLSARAAMRDALQIACATIVLVAVLVVFRSTVSEDAALLLAAIPSATAAYLGILLLSHGRHVLRLPEGLRVRVTGTRM